MPCKWALTALEAGLVVLAAVAVLVGVVSWARRLAESPPTLAIASETMSMRSHRTIRVSPQGLGSSACVKNRPRPATLQPTKRFILGAVSTK
jgi:hypothetical protein